MRTRLAIEFWYILKGRMKEKIVKDVSDKKFKVSVWNGPIENGGRDRNRTCDPQHAMLMLSQLSYTPLAFNSKI
jgi:hypothetical protein